MFEFNSKLNCTYLTEMYGDDTEMAQMMFEHFLNNSIPEWNTIIPLIEEQNLDAVLRLVHKNKPTFMMVGLSEIHDKIRNFEKDIRSGLSWNDIANRCEAISLEINSFSTIIQHEINRLSDFVES